MDVPVPMLALKRYGRFPAGKVQGTGMNIGQIKYFVAAYEEGSFSAAARRQFVTVQAVSKAVADLEHELGQSLFDRGGRSIQPTDFGVAFYGRATGLLEKFDELKAFPDECLRAKESRSYRFLLCAPAFHNNGHFLVKLSKLLSGIIGAPLECSLSRVQAGIERLLARDVDVLITIGQLEHPEIECMPIATMPTGVVMAPDHPLAFRESVSLEDLGAYPILRSEEFDDFNESVLSVYFAQGFSAQTVHVGPGTEGFDFDRFLKDDRGLVFCAAIPALFNDLEGVAMRPIDAQDAEPIPLCLNALFSRRASLGEMFSKLLPNLNMVMQGLENVDRP